MNVTILIGTMTGTAQLVAQEIELTYGDDATAIEARVMDGLDASALDPATFGPNDVVLVCTSTYGQGDVPDNAKELYASLDATRPDLSALRYGLIALGDRTYNDTFCFGGKKFDALLSDLGARRIGEVLLHDASAGTMPEEVAGAWAGKWLEQARDEVGAAV